MPVKPSYIKDTAAAIIRNYRRYVSDDFDENKELVEEITNIESKTVRNRVAGYLTRRRASDNMDVDKVGLN